MEFSTTERAILDRYHEKCRIAGGPRKGYVLRRETIHLGASECPPEALDAGLASLVERGVLAASEDGRFFFLGEPGVEALSDWNGTA